MQELESRLLAAENRYNAAFLVPTKLAGLSAQVCRQIYTTFEDDLPAASVDVFTAEVDRWKARWAIANNPKPGTVGDAIKSTIQQLYPNVFTCLAVLATMPVATATAERSFSVMRRVKTYL